MYDYIKVGDYYMARQRINDFTPDSFKYRQKNHLFIYNSNFEPVKDCIFDNYVSDMGYCNGNFYVELYNTAEYNRKYIVKKTNDFENWVECDEGIPIESNGIYVTSNKALMKNRKVYDIEKEADHTIANKSCGKFLWTNELLTNDGKRPVIITIDNIYNYKLINDCYCHFAYQYDDKIYFTDNLSQVQRTVSLDEINNILEPFKNAPYVIYNDKILAFEQPPVIQDDRTLIPIRFLFEQMGATVDWDGETRTATIAQNDRTITFSIDSTTATVNGQPTQMDVPARLISGKTMVPLRFLSENLGYTVDWDGENRIITIDR